jgi:integrase-like protein
MRLHFRREILKNLGWTIIDDSAVFPPGVDPDDAVRIPNLVVAARDAGLPEDVDELSRWAKGSRQVSGIIRKARESLLRSVGRSSPTGLCLSGWAVDRRPAPVAGRRVAVSDARTAGRHWESSSARKQLARTAAKAGVRRRFVPHQLRHAHAVEMAHEGVPLVVIQGQLGYENLRVTPIYLQGIDSSEIISTVHSRPATVIPATTGLHTGSRPVADGRLPGQRLAFRAKHASETSPQKYRDKPKQVRSGMATRSTLPDPSARASGGRPAASARAGGPSP